MEKKQKDSKQLIMDSLVQFINSKEYSRISITELCENAEVARRTFYRYFKNIDDVLKDYINSLCYDYVIKCINMPSDSSSYSVMYFFFSFWEQHKELFHLLKENNLSSLVMNNYKEYLAIVNDRFFSELQSHFNEQDIEYYYLFLIGGIWNMLTKWLCEKTVETPEEMAKRALSLLKYNLVEDQ